MLCLDASPVGAAKQQDVALLTVKGAKKVTHDTNRVYMTSDVSLPFCTAADKCYSTSNIG